MEGYCSIEEQTQDYIALFMLLQQKNTETKSLQTSFGKAGRSIADREQASNIFLPSVHLKKCYALTETAFFLVMFAFCCEIEGGLCLEFREKYHERRPNLQYALHLLSAVLPVDFAQIAQLSQEEGELGDILAMSPEGGENGGLLLQPLVLNRSAFHFLLTGTLRKEAWYRPFFPGENDEWEELPGEQELLPLHEWEAGILCHHIQTNCHSVRPEKTRPFRILLHGSRGVGKHTLLCRVCCQQSVNAIFVNLRRMQREERRLWERNRRTLRLFCRLAMDVVVLEFTENRSETVSDSRSRVESMDILLEESLGDMPVIFLTETQECARMAERFAQLWLEPAQRLTPAEQKLALETWLKPEERRKWQTQLLGKYRLNIGEFREKQKAVTLWAEAEGVSPADPAAWEAGLRERNVLSGLGRVIENSDASEEIVLSEECRRQLETVIELAKGWTGRQGLHLLFHGSSGTGKTMAASILAKRLHLPLFKVDLSQIFDKYIGETEKHMDEIFHTAQKNHYLLFFDEADALFSKRTGIQDARDKYANVSTSYLLQRIEEYDGMLIMATNLLNHFDDAFVRRVRFVIKFRNLDEGGRELLWEKALAGELPVAEDVSYRELSRAAELSPARIRAAARVAGMLAVCEESSFITKEHLRRALELEAGKDETTVRGF